MSDPMETRQLLHSWLCFFVFALASSMAQGQDEYFQPHEYEYGQAGTTDTMLHQQYQALQMGVANSEGCRECGTCGGYNRCGCNTALFPWIDGPGSCDQWCVGPKWNVTGGGLFMFRDDADWDRVVVDAGANNTLPGFLQQQFDHAMGGRLFATGYSEAGYGIEIGWEGINDWEATLAFEPDDPVAGQTRSFTYQSRLNSVEINFLPHPPSVWKLYTGLRYLQLDEDFIDYTSDDANRFVPAPADPPGVTQAFDLQQSRLIRNHLLGLQVGGRRDAWQLGRWITLESFANAGVYCNRFRRDDVTVNITTTITGDDTTTTDTELIETSSSLVTGTRRNLTEVAFVGEAGIAAAWRLNNCLAVRAGYQILALDGVGGALDAAFAPGLNADTQIFHGLQFGMEYQR